MAIHFPEEIRTKAKELKKQGKSYKEISRILCIRAHTIWRWFKNYHYTPRNYNGERLRALFELVKAKTFNFTSISPKLLAENTHYLIVFRHMMMLSENRLCQKIGISRSQLVACLAKQTFPLDHPHYGPICQKIDSLTENYLREHPAVRQIDFKELKKRRKRGLALSVPPKNHLDYHKAQENIPLDETESAVAAILHNAGIPFQSHSYLNAYSREVNVDFVIPSKQKPQFVIEVTKITSYHEKRSLMVERRIRELDHRLYDIKKTHKDCRLLLVLFTNLEINPKLFFFSDAYFTQDTLHKLPEFINNYAKNRDSESAIA